MGVKVLTAAVLASALLLGLKISPTRACIGYDVNVVNLGPCDGTNATDYSSNFTISVDSRCNLRLHTELPCCQDQLWPVTFTMNAPERSIQKIVAAIKSASQKDLLGSLPIASLPLDLLSSLLSIPLSLLSGLTLPDIGLSADVESNIKTTVLNKDLLDSLAHGGLLSALGIQLSLPSDLPIVGQQRGLGLSADIVASLSDEDVQNLLALPQIKKVKEFIEEKSVDGELSVSDRDLLGGLLELPLSLVGSLLSLPQSLLSSLPIVGGSRGISAPSIVSVDGELSVLDKDLLGGLLDLPLSLVGSLLSLPQSLLSSLSIVAGTRGISAPSIVSVDGELSVLDKDLLGGLLELPLSLVGSLLSLPLSLLGSLSIVGGNRGISASSIVSVDGELSILDKDLLGGLLDLPLSLVGSLLSLPLSLLGSLSIGGGTRGISAPSIVSADIVASLSDEDVQNLLALPQIKKVKEFIGEKSVDGELTVSDRDLLGGLLSLPLSLVGSLLSLPQSLLSSLPIVGGTRGLSAPSIVSVDGELSVSDRDLIGGLLDLPLSLVGSLLSLPQSLLSSLSIVGGTRGISAPSIVSVDGELSILDKDLLGGLLDLPLSLVGSLLSLPQSLLGSLPIVGGNRGISAPSIVSVDGELSILDKDLLGGLLELPLSLVGSLLSLPQSLLGSLPIVGGSRGISAPSIVSADIVASLSDEDVQNLLAIPQIKKVKEILEEKSVDGELSVSDRDLLGGLLSLPLSLVGSLLSLPQSLLSSLPIVGGTRGISAPSIVSVDGELSVSDRDLIGGLLSLPLSLVGSLLSLPQSLLSSLSIVAGTRGISAPSIVSADIVASLSDEDVQNLLAIPQIKKVKEFIGEKSADGESLVSDRDLLGGLLDLPLSLVGSLLNLPLSLLGSLSIVGGTRGISAPSIVSADIVASLSDEDVQNLLAIPQIKKVKEFIEEKSVDGELSVSDRDLLGGLLSLPLSLVGSLLSLPQSLLGSLSIVGGSRGISAPSIVSADIVASLSDEDVHNLLALPQIKKVKEFLEEKSVDVELSVSDRDLLGGLLSLPLSLVGSLLSLPQTLLGSLPIVGGTRGISAPSIVSADIVASLSDEDVQNLLAIPQIKKVKDVLEEKSVDGELSVSDRDLLGGLLSLPLSLVGSLLSLPQSLLGSLPIVGGTRGISAPSIVSADIVASLSDEDVQNLLALPQIKKVKEFIEEKSVDGELSVSDRDLLGGLLDLPLSLVGSLLSLVLSILSSLPIVGGSRGISAPSIVSADIVASLSDEDVQNLLAIPQIKKVKEIIGEKSADGESLVSDRDLLGGLLELPLSLVGSLLSLPLSLLSSLPIVGGTRGISAQAEEILLEQSKRRFVLGELGGCKSNQNSGKGDSCINEGDCPTGCPIGKGVRARGFVSLLRMTAHSGPSFGELALETESGAVCAKVQLEVENKKKIEQVRAPV